MSVKDRLDRLEERIGEPNFEFPLGPHSEMIHDLRVGMRNIEASRDGLYDRIESNNKFIVSASSITADLSDGIEELNSDINTLKEALPDVEDKINSLEKKIENYNPDDFIRGDLHRKCNYLHRCMEGVQLKINEFEALEARVEERENDEADTRRNAEARQDSLSKSVGINYDFIKTLIDSVNSLEVEAFNNRQSTPDNSAKPGKFIKGVDDDGYGYMLPFNKLDAIQSNWDEEDDKGEIVFTTLAACNVKTYSDKEAWQHDLNKIEWFIYDDALLLDLTDLVAPDMGVHWNPPSNHHDICPICKERMVYYVL